MLSFRTVSFSAMRFIYSYGDVFLIVKIVAFAVQALPISDSRYSDMINQFFFYLTCKIWIRQRVVQTGWCHMQYSPRNNSITA